MGKRALATAVVAAVMSVPAVLAGPAGAEPGSRITPSITPAGVPTALPEAESGIRPPSAQEQALLTSEQGATGAIMGHTGPAAAAQALPQGNTWMAPGTQGVDVSNWDGEVDWPAVSRMGAAFAYAKATEGLTYKSPTWRQQYTGAEAQGLIRGSYHFALPPISSGAEQARYFVANGGGWSPDGKTLPPLLDIEFNKYPNRFGNMCYNMSPAQLSAWIGDFVRTMDQLIGRHPAIYTNKYWWDTCVQSASFGEYPLHVARYGQTPPDMPVGWSRHHIWQYSESGPFVGDSNAFNGSYAQLYEWARNESSVSADGPAATRLPSTMSAGASLTSPNQMFRLVMQGDGNLVTYDAQGRAVWSSRTGVPGMRLATQRDGNVVLYDSKGAARWFTATSLGDPRLVLQDDGNLVLRDGGSVGAWDAFGFSRRPTYRVETTVTELAPGAATYSLAGGRLLAMQPDGNLVVYAGNRSLWQSGTAGMPGARFVLQPDGNAVVYFQGRPVWQSATFNNPGASMVLQSDGNLVIYNGSRALWASRT